MRIETLAASLALTLAIAAAPAAAHIVVYEATLTGPDEFPTNTSPGTGTARVTVDEDLLTMRVQVSFSGLTGNTTASHIHCCTPNALGQPLAGVATETPTFVDFPLGVRNGTYDHTYSLALRTTYNASTAASSFFVLNGGGTISGAMNALIGGLDNGTAYLNIHTSTFPGGEIRGFLHAVPEPETYALMAAGLGLVGWAAARRRKTAAA